jgi:predicted MFS family arabinose efflux permease
MPLRIIKIYRNAFSGLSAPNWYLSLVMLINRSGTMVLPFMTLYLTQHLGFSETKAGLAVGVFGLGSVCGALIGGRLTDRVGFYPVQVFTLLGGGILFILLGQMRSYEMICLFVFLLSLVNEAFRPANQTATAFYSTPENRTRSYTLNRLAINIGWACGSALGGLIASYNYEWLFWVDGITNIAATFLLLLLLPYSKQQKAHLQAVHENEVPVPDVYADKTYLYFVAFTTLFAVCFFQLFSTVPVFWKEEWQLSEKNIGQVMAVNGLIIALFEMPLIAYLDGRVNNLRTIVVGVLLVCFSYIMFNLFTPGLLVALLSTVVVTAGEMFSMPFMNAFWTARSVHGNRGQYASLYTMSYSIAFVIGPVSGTAVAAEWGYATLWWVVGLLCTIGAAGYYWLYQKQHRKQLS